MILLGDCVEKLKEVEKESVDLVIADPPYLRVIGEKWDYKWKTEKEYVEWCLTWLNDVSRVLRKGGTFYLFGYYRTLAFLMPYFEDLGLELRQQILVDKGMQAVSGRATKNYKLFPNTTESILFLVKDNKVFLKPFLKERQRECNLNSKQINELLGVKSNGGGMWSIYTGNNICEQFPTETLWNKLQEILKFQLEYKKVSQTFNPIMGLTDIWRDIDFYEEKRVHPTQKPLKLIKRLIVASSNENDLVLDPFGGSGATAIAALMLKRRYIIIESNPEYIQIIRTRVERVGNPMGGLSSSIS